MHLVIKMVPELGEYGITRELFVKFHDPDGNELMKLSGMFNVPKSQGGLIPEVNVILALNDLVFPQPGPYQFIVMVEKDHKGSLSLLVNKLETPSPNQG
jgi:hypothetical protein